ncbi:TPA: DNA circularization N-terminal domain-containing protein [Burkholderia vietnamiensis]|uniref:DNA circularization protein n=1 Tax=Burkholderia vietnamiensis TaxID=60552 RepID=UPI0015931604|nr:DNA circularization N-terminal domain-containing protein [Burkholderia vietnamiensis]MBR7910094.1 DNA circularization N-terminal domain-containing protein [Burkholderia vietnamiensis]HDR9274166.1 DNA circularization N-terminal domain-containing protein [Burkholderia vietnamiensis]
MAWENTLFDASFRGVPFDVQRTDDTIDRDTAEYAVPHVDGEDVEDLGLKAHTVSIAAIFFGDDYEERMKALLAALAIKGPGELLHPVFGSMPSMQLIGAHVSHDADNVDACVIEMRFKRSTPANPFFVEQRPTQTADAAAQLATVAQDAGTSMFERAIGLLKTMKAGLRRLNALRDVLSETLGPIKALVVGFRGASVDYLSWPGAFASDLIGLVSGIADFRSFDPGLVMSDWNDMRDQMKTVVKLPAASAAGQPLTIPGTQAARAASSEPVDPAAPYAPARPGTVASDSSDVQLVTAVTAVVVATVTAGVASDVLSNEADTPTLTPDQVEQIANDTRELIQTAIDAVRAAVPIEQARPVIEPLKETALTVQELAVKVIDILPPIVSRSVDAPSNLTLLAHLWYADYSRAAELLRLNPQIRNPNVIQRGDIVRGFAQ